MPPAPPMFSTTNCCPRISLTRCAMMRPSTSVVPPAAKGTTMVTGRDGQPCEFAASVNAKRPATATPTFIVSILASIVMGSTRIIRCNRFHVSITQATADQHFHFDRQRAVGPPAQKTASNILANGAAYLFRQADIFLPAQGRSALNATEVVIEGRELQLAAFALDVNIVKARASEQCLEMSRIVETKITIEPVRRAWNITSDGRADAHIQRTLRYCGDADRHAPAASQHPVKLGKSTTRIGEQHQTKLTEHSIKPAIGIR